MLILCPCPRQVHTHKYVVFDFCVCQCASIVKCVGESTCVRPLYVYVSHDKNSRLLLVLYSLSGWF